MDLRLAGVFVKRVCVLGSPVPGEGPGNTTTPTFCDTEPTALLVVVVAGAFLLLLAILVLLTILVVRRRPVPVAAPMSYAVAPVVEPTSLHVPPAPTVVAAPPAPVTDGRARGRNWRDVYGRLLDFVDKAMADVGRTMPEERSMPVSPPRFENEQSGTLGAELTVLGSAHVHAAHAAWSHALFQFYLLARDVNEAHAKNLAESQYRHEVLELRRTRSSVYELADALRRQATQELRA
jgi:hypothetical protein